MHSVLARAHEERLMPDADVAVRADQLVELHPVRIMDLIATARVGSQLLERAPVLNVRGQAQRLPAQKAALRLCGDFRQHLRHRREEPQVPGQLPPAVETRADHENDEVSLDRGGYAAVDGGHAAGVYRKRTDRRDGAADDQRRESSRQKRCETGCGLDSSAVPRLLSCTTRRRPAARSVSGRGSSTRRSPQHASRPASAARADREVQ